MLGESRGLYCLGGTWQAQRCDAPTQSSCWAVTASPHTCGHCLAQPLQCPGERGPQNLPKANLGSRGWMKESNVPAPVLREIPNPKQTQAPSYRPQLENRLHQRNSKGRRKPPTPDPYMLSRKISDLCVIKQFVFVYAELIVQNL